MSTPQHPHHLAREQAKGAGGIYVAARFAQMRCDGAMGRCPIPPERAPVIAVPAKASVLVNVVGAPMSAKGTARMNYRLGAAPRPLAKFTTLHYCREHWNFAPELTIERLLTDPIMRELEDIAKRNWPHEYRPDFAAAYIDWVLVTTPEYRRFLLEIERSRNLQIGGVPLL